MEQSLFVLPGNRIVSGCQFLAYSFSTPASGQFHLHSVVWFLLLFFHSLSLCVVCWRPSGAGALRNRRVQTPTDNRIIHSNIQPSNICFLFFCSSLFFLALLLLDCFPSKKSHACFFGTPNTSVGHFSNISELMNKKNIEMIFVDAESTNNIIIYMMCQAELYKWTNVLLHDVKCVWYVSDARVCVCGGKVIWNSPRSARA